MAKLLRLFLCGLVLFVAFADYSDGKPRCEDLKQDALKFRQKSGEDAEGFNSALAEFLCDGSGDSTSHEVDDDDDDDELRAEEEVPKRVKRSPFWGGGGRSSSSSSSSSSSRSSGGFWGGGRRSSSSSSSSSSPKKSGGFWGGGRRKTTSSSKPKKTSFIDKVHTALDVAGLAPGVGVVPDAINTGLHAVRGNWKDAALSAAAMVPGAGQGVTAAKLAAKAAAKIDRVSDAAKVTRSFTKKTGKTETVKQSSSSARELQGLFEKATGKKHSQPGVSVGRTSDGKTLTFRDRSKTGPATLDVNKDGHITKIRCSGCEKP